MKKTLLFLLVLSASNLLGQNKYTEQFKSLKKSKIESYNSLFYNTLVDKSDIYFVKLDLEVSNLSADISGNVILKMKTLAELDILGLDFYSNMVIDSMFINDNEVLYEHRNNKLRYVFDTPLASGVDFKVQIYYHGTPNGAGVFNNYNSEWNKNVTYSLSEPFDARAWWPCKQVLSDKIDSAYIFLTCADTCMAGSNGLLKNVVELPDNKKRFEWKTFHPTDYYLISFSVSDYQDYSIYAHPEGADSILIQNFIYNHPDYLTTNKEDIDKTIDLIELFSEKFGLYPFSSEKYGHCLSTFGGGMEHQTMTTIGNFNFLLVAHELGHMWFGDYVTCASWQDIWINEGFASYTEYVALENLKTITETEEWLDYAQLSAWYSPEGSVYIPFEDAFNESRIFDLRLSYRKGAVILHILRHEINDDELFFSSIRHFLSEYKNSVATGEDFKNSIENSTGIEFDTFFDQWYYGKGYPRFDVEYQQVNDILHMTVNQSTSSAETPLFKLNLDFKINFTEGDTTLRLFQSKNLETYNIPLKGTVTGIVVDPDKWVLKENGNVVLIETISADTTNTDTTNTVNVEDLPEINKSLFSFSPNPVKETIKVNFKGNLYDQNNKIQIMDLNGKLIKSYILNSNSYPIDVSFLSNGIYFIRGISTNKSYTYKFVKQ